MDKDVLIRINSQQVSSGEPEVVETMSVGRYFLKNGKHFLVFQEVVEDDLTVNNMIRISDREISVKKTGAIETEMLYDPERETACDYRTAMGMFRFDIETKRIRFSETEEKIAALINSVLKLDGAVLAENLILIEVLPKNSGVRLRDRD